MILVNGRYTVRLSMEATPVLDGYPVWFRAEDAWEQDFFCARLIEVDCAYGDKYRFALTDHLLSGGEECAVLEDDILTVILFDSIVQIDLNKRIIINRVECENIGGLEGIRRCGKRYILKGECSIFGYDNDLKRMWVFGGRDIFARANGEECFWIDNGSIHCRDWAGWHYVLDMDGNLMSEVCEKHL